MPDLQDAISLLEKGNTRDAAVLLEALANDMPGYATARVLLARSYEGLGEWDGALASWREAIQIVPNSPVIQRGLVRAARKASSLAPVDELPELPSVSVSEPTDIAPEVADDASGPEEVSPVPAFDEPDAGSTGSYSQEAASDTLEYAPPDVTPEDRASDIAPEDAPPDVTPEVTREDTPSDVTPEDTPPDDLQEVQIEDSEPLAADVKELERRPFRADDEDLDRLIAELESARIMPRPDFDGLPEPELEDDIEDVVSVTLARIYASQGQYDEAARVYDLLAGQQPENATEFKAKADEMRSKASED